MNLLDFYRQYPDEASCESALRKFRKHHGLFCSQVSVSLTGSNCALAHINQDLNIESTDWQHADIHKINCTFAEIKKAIVHFPRYKNDLGKPREQTCCMICHGEKPHS